MRLLIAISAWLLLCSAVSVALYAWDKFRARRGGRRVRERTLLLVAIAGGWPGSLLGQSLFRHKTLKQPYRRRLSGCITVNIAVLVALGWISLRSDPDNPVHENVQNGLDSSPISDQTGLE